MLISTAGVKSGESEGEAVGLGATPAFGSVGATTSIAGPFGTHIIAHPATVNAGDILICVAVGRNNNENVTLAMHANMTAAGWVHITGSPFNQNASTAAMLLAWKLAVGDEDGTNIPGGIVATGGASSDSFVAHCQRWTAADGFAANPFESLASFVDVSNFSIAGPTVTPTGENRRGVIIFGGNGAPATFNFTGETGGDWTAVAHVTESTLAVINTNSADLSAGTPISGGTATLSAAAGGSVVSFALVPSGTGGGDPDPPGDPLWMAYCPSYDLLSMPGTEIPFSLGITHLKHFAAWPTVTSGVASVNLSFFNPPMIPTHLNDIKSARTAAGSSAKILMVLGGANSHGAFISCLSYNVGTVSATSGSPTVTGSGTSWTSAFDGLPFILDATFYTVQTVNSATSLTLTANYAGTTGGGKGYRIHWPARQTQFIDNTLALAATHAYDGIDVDWEGISYGDATQYTLVTDYHIELGQALHSVGKILTTSSFGRIGPAGAPAQNDFRDRCITPGHIDYLYIQFIAMALPGFSSQTVWHHSATRHNTSDYGTPTGNAAVGLTEALTRYINTLAWPANRLIVGHQWGALRWIGGNMTSPAGSVGRGARFPIDRWNGAGGAGPIDLSTEMLYREIIASADYPGDLERDVLAGQIPFLAHTGATPNQDYFIPFEDAVSIAHKTAYSLSQGVAGMGVWHINSDYNPAGGTVAEKHPLAAALSTALFG